MRAEEGEKKAAAPTKPAIGPKRGSMVRRAVAWLALPAVVRSCSVCLMEFIQACYLTGQESSGLVHAAGQDTAPGVLLVQRCWQGCVC